MPKASECQALRNLIRPETPLVNRWCHFNVISIAPMTQKGPPQNERLCWTQDQEVDREKWPTSGGVTALNHHWTIAAPCLQQVLAKRGAVARRTPPVQTSTRFLLCILVESTTVEICAFTYLLLSNSSEREIWKHLPRVASTPSPSIDNSESCLIDLDHGWEKR